jgi:hypothetical protein
MSASLSDPDFWETVPSASERWLGELAALSGQKFAATRLGFEDDLSAPVAALLQLVSGDVLPRHAHSCWRYEIIIAGSWLCPDGSELLPGHIRVSEPGEFYGPFTAGLDGNLSLEIFSTAERTLIRPEAEDPISAKFWTRFESAAGEPDSEARRYLAEKVATKEAQ